MAPNAPTSQADNGSNREADFEWAVKRPDGFVFKTSTEDEARGWVEASNYGGRNRYRLLRRPVAEWEDVTDVN